MDSLMTIEEITSGLKNNDYGELYYLNRGRGIRAVGTVRYITTDGDIVFSHNDYNKKIMIRPENVKDFTPKEKLPPPTEIKGEKAFFDGGRWINEKGEEVDLKR